MHRLPLLSLLGTCALPACADLPLSVEDIITARGMLKSEITFAYANSERHSVSLGEAIVVQTGAASFFTIPTAIGDRHVNTDAVVSTLGVRYGISSNSEGYFRISSTRLQQRCQELNRTSQNVMTEVADAWLGIAHQFKPDDATPAILGFFELALEERHRDSTSYLQSVMLGLTSYTAIDPVVMSATMAGRYGKSRLDGTLPFQPGNLYLFNPSVTFAVNDRVTLTGGMQWTWKQADQLNQRPVGIDRSSTDLVTGMGYVVSNGNTVNTSFRVNASGKSGSELRMTWLYTFR